MSKPHRNKPFLSLDDPLVAAKQRKAVPHEFVLDAIASLSPRTHPMFGCLAVYVEDKIVLILATSARRRQTTVCGSPPPRSTTKVCDASFRICDPFRYSGRRSPAGRFFRPMRQISRRRRCAPASSLSPWILESARCRGRGRPRDRAPRRSRDPMRKQRHPREPRKVGCGREQLGSKEWITSCLRTKQELVSGDSHGA